MKIGPGKRKRRDEAAQSTPKQGEKPAGKEQPSRPTVEPKKTLVQRGYARAGELIATVKPAVFGKEGKNVLGENIPARQVYVPRLVPGMNVTVEKGTHFFMRTSGVVEVMKDEKGSFYIKGKLYHRGQCSISVSDDEMTVTLSIQPPIGGAKHVTVDDVLGKLAAEGIRFGVDREAIERAVAGVQESGEPVTDLVIAQGAEPIHGRDGVIEFQVMRASGSAVRVRSDGSADFKNLDRITSVKPGQLVALMRRETPSQRDGHTVRGEVYKARGGKSVEIELGDNIRVEEKAGTIEYYSQINGQLITDGRKLSVEPVLVIEGDVGPKTGNIKFSGIVHVRGSVQDTFNVSAKKDIRVDGNVGNSVILSDENLYVKGGIVAKSKGLIRVGGDVSTKFAENANIQAGGTIYILRAALNSRMIAGSKIIALQEKGQIIGGDIRAREGIDVKSLGNESEHRMEAYAGLDFSVGAQLDTVQGKIQKYERALKKIVLIIDKLKKVNPDPVLLPDNLRKLYGETRKKGTIAKIAINELRKRQSELLNKFEQIYDAEIIVREALYRGVKIHIGKSIYEPEALESNVRITYNRKKDSVQVERVI